MKKIHPLSYALLVCALLCSITSCRHHEEPEWPEDDDTTSININNGGGISDQIYITEMPSKSIVQPGGQTHVSFKTKNTWEIIVPEQAKDWVTVTPDKGKEGKNVASITLKENKSYDERNCGIIIKSGTASATVTITQKQLDAILVSSHKIEVSAEGAPVDIEVMANINYETQILKGAEKWLSMSTSKKLTSKIIRINVKENTSLVPRRGTITFTGDTQAEEVEIYQYGADETLVVSSEHNVIPQEGGEVKVELRSNSIYNVLEPPVDWLRRNKDKSQSSYTLYYTVAENKSLSPRDCYIVYTTANARVKDTVYITQEAFKEKMEITSDKEINLKSAASEISVTIKTNCNYSIEMPEWIKGKLIGNSGETTYKFEVSNNPDYTDRMGKIVFTNTKGDIKCEVSVFQDKKVDGLTLVSVPEGHMPQKSSTATVTFKASERWVTTLSEGSHTWISIEPASGEKDITEFTITTTNNNLYTERTGYITLKTGMLQEVIKITQDGVEPELEVRSGAQGIHAPYTGGEVEITAYSNVEYKVESPSWAKCKNPNGASGTNKHVFTVGENLNANDLQGEIVLTTLDGKKSVTVPITQSKLADLLEINNVNKTTLEVTGGDAKIIFSTNQDWTASVSGNASSWLFLNPKNGGLAGNKIDLVVTASMNELFEERSGVVTITAGSLSEQFTFKQPAAVPSLEIVSGESDHKGDAGGISKIVVNANVDYTITKPSWISGPSEAAKGQSTLQFTVGRNTNYENRTGIIRFENANYNLAKEAKITQSAKEDELTVSLSSISFMHIGQNQKIELYASEGWTAESSAPWVTVTPSSGKTGEAVVTISSSENATIDKREASVTFTCGRMKQVIDISQDATPVFLKVNSGSILEVSHKETKVDLTVSSNCDYSITLPAWISGPSEGKAGNSTHTFTIQPNAEYYRRDGNIQFSNSKYGAFAKVTVFQQLKTEEINIISAPDDIIPADGGSITVEFYASDPWTIQLPNYVSASAAQGLAGNNTVKLTFEPNNELNARFAEILIKCGKVQKLLEYFQSKKK